MASAGLFAKVLIDAPGLEPLDYRVPEEMLVAVGDLVTVTLGSRKVVGLVASLSGASDFAEKRLKNILSVLHIMAPLRPEWLALTAFAASYYLRGWGESSLPFIPSALRKNPTVQQDRRIDKIRAAMSKPGGGKLSVPPKLNDEQLSAVRQVLTSSGFQSWLLFGVTGSGKTEVYLQLLAAVLERDSQAQALLLVPEINLTPQLVERVKARFPDEAVAALNSEFSETERAAAWLSVHEGKARILVGTRMAIFASFQKLALILVDEEHDLSYKAGDGLRYSARDLAVWRASKLGCPVVLGSATPSLESWCRMKEGRYRLLKLTKRAASHALLPDVELTDPAPRGALRMISDVSQEALKTCLEEGRQALVFLNRRGYSPVLSCPSCGWVSSCSRCSAFMVFHKREKAMICHHCGWRRTVPEACPSCGNVDILPRGTGTERIEEELSLLFPDRRVLRIDRDSASKKHSAEDAFRKVHQGMVDILVGTQMIAKGHDFQNIGLVLVLNPDAQILSPSTRAKEQLFATLMQVAGRAGRAGKRGRVLIQTRFPEDPLFGALAVQNYVQFADAALEERRENVGVPFVRQAMLYAEADSVSKALNFLKSASAEGQRLASPEVMIFDPVPMALVRINNRERAQLLVESNDHAQLRRFLKQWNQAIKTIRRPSSMSVCLEVDPMSN